jgi:chromatin assembly factor 1 subunit A
MRQEDFATRFADSTLPRTASLKEFMSRASLERIPSTSKLDVQPINSVMAALQEYEIQGDMESYHRLRAQLRNTDKYPLKLIKFHLDVRPGYFGTWTKKSDRVSGRNPFSRDIDLLDYEYDSEAEWDEDPEDAEDIKDDSGDEEMLSGDSEDDLDGWLAGDDEVEFEAGYDGEMLPLDDANDPFAAPQVPGDEGKRKAKKTGKPAVRRKKNTGPLVTIIKGPYWEDEGNDEEEDDERSGLEKLMSGFRISWLNENESK